MAPPKPIPITRQQENSKPSRSFAARWKHKELLDSGYVPLPISFLELYANLKPLSLTPGEAMFVIHLMQYKWDDQAPFPGYKRIATQMGISHKMAREHAKSLEQKKLLRREMRVGQTNKFDLTPLFDALARAMRKQRQKRGKAAKR